MSNRKALRDWVRAVAAHARPTRIHWCDGSEVERWSLERELIASGTMHELDLEGRPRSFLYSPVSTSKRTESMIATRAARDAGPMNNWIGSEVARDLIWPLFAGSMTGRTMYVVPYLLGPAASSFSRVGVEVTDSPYAVLGLRAMASMGNIALEHFDFCGPFVRGLHSVGQHSQGRQFLVHWPEEQEVWSFGSDTAAQSVLSSKCHALRLASAQALKQGWLAESMALLGVTSPAGQTHFVAAALPHGCGKTELATLVPTLPGWRIDMLSDAACWMRPGRDGRLWAVNPETGICGSAPQNPRLRQVLTKDVLFERTESRGTANAVTFEPVESDPDVRFTAPFPVGAHTWETFDESRGVPISAILFGTRRSKVVPLVYEARRWAHGVYVGATMSSERFDRTNGPFLHSDPMGMRDYCAYDLGDYLEHWLSIGRKLTRAPKIFHVNWFRSDATGRLLWPGFGENIRVLKWILERVEGVAGRLDTPIGFVPGEGALDLTGLSLTEDAMFELRAVDCAAWREEAEVSSRLFATLEGSLPNELRAEHAALLGRLSRHAN